MSVPGNFQCIVFFWNDGLIFRLIVLHFITVVILSLTKCKISDAAMRFIVVVDYFNINLALYILNALFTIIIIMKKYLKNICTE